MAKNKLKIEDFRDVITEQIQALRAGTGDVNTAKALANLVGKSMKTVSLEMEYAVHLRSGGKKIDMME